MTAKVLLVDTNFSSQPIADYILSLGMELHVVGRKPSDALAKSPYVIYWDLDYSDVEQLQKLIDDQGFDYLVPGCTDVSYSVCSMIGENAFFNIESQKNDRALNRKNEFRALAESLNISVPKTLNKSELIYPLIVKPVDSFSGLGISIVNTNYEVNKALKYAESFSPSKMYTVEEYLKGQLYSFSAFLENERVVQSFIVREDSTINPFAVDLSMVEHDFPPTLKQELKLSIEKLASNLSLNDGLIHVQFIMSDSKIFLIEVTRRCPGDLYSQLIELQTDFNYIENYVRPFLGMKLKINPSTLKKEQFIRHTITTKQEKVYLGIQYKMPCIIEKWVPLATTGDLLPVSPKGRAGVMFLKALDMSECIPLYNALYEKSLYGFI